MIWGDVTEIEGQWQIRKTILRRQLWPQHCHNTGGQKQWGHLPGRDEECGSLVCSWWHGPFPQGIWVTSTSGRRLLGPPESVPGHLSLCFQGDTIATLPLPAQPPKAFVLWAPWVWGNVNMLHNWSQATYLKAQWPVGGISQFCLAGSFLPQWLTCRAWEKGNWLGHDRNMFPVECRDSLWEETGHLLTFLFPVSHPELLGRTPLQVLCSKCPSNSPTCNYSSGCVYTAL